MLRSSFFAISILIARLIFDAAKGLSLRTCPYLPEVSPAWRENGTQEFPQLDQFPLSVGELNASIPRYPIDRQSLAHFIHKLATTNRTSPSSPASVRVAVFGGSFTRGNGCFSTPYHQRGVRQRILCSWSHRLIRWLRAAFPNTKVDILFYAAGSTTSMHMVRLVQNQIDLTEIDLALVDYSCNDAFTLSQSSTDADEALLITTETILRAFIAHNASIPVIYISEFLQHSFSEAIYEKVCQVYGVPVLSYRRALQDRIQRKNVSFFWADNLGEVHPPWTTHQMITDMITTYIFAEATWMCSTTPLLKREIAQAPQFSFPLSPVFYSVNTEAADNCSSWRLYSQHADELALRNVSKLLPWFASEAQNHYAGWQLRSDVAGKPVGWIAESKASSVSSAHIVFRFYLMVGKVAISYLSTYRNAAQPLIREGKIEVWVSRALNYGSNGGFRSRREVDEPLDTLLVHTKKQPTYEESFSSKRDSYVKTTHLSASENLLKPALYNVMETFTHSGYVDSFSDKFNVSEVKEQVLHFGASGEVLIHIRHVNLTRDEMMKRGGDKFKLFSIRVC